MINNLEEELDQLRKAQRVWADIAGSYKDVNVWRYLKNLQELLEIAYKIEYGNRNI
jgi:hypothetical protein